MAGADDLVGLGRFGDHADGASGEASFAADAISEGYLITGADGDLLARVIASGGDVEKVDALGLHQAREFYDFVDGEAAIHPVGRGDTDPDRKMVGEGSTDGADDL